jgi:hypothetical protein
MLALPPALALAIGCADRWRPLSRGRSARRRRCCPLVEALGKARPAGSRSSAATGSRCWNGSRTGSKQLQEIGLAEPDPEGRRRPGGMNPADRQPGPERDRFERAHDARVASEVRGAGEELSRLAAERDWDVLVVDGDPRLAGELEPAFAATGCELVRSPVPLGRLAAAEVAERVQLVLAEVRAREETRLVQLLETSPLVTPRRRRGRSRSRSGPRRPSPARPVASGRRRGAAAPRRRDLCGREGDADPGRRRGARALVARQSGSVSSRWG